jgi:hypothetical protein
MCACAVAPVACGEEDDDGASQRLAPQRLPVGAVRLEQRQVHTRNGAERGRGWHLRQRALQAANVEALARAAEAAQEQDCSAHVE